MPFSSSTYSTSHVIARVTRLARKVISSDTAAPSGPVVPRPATHEPLHGAHTPTIAPVAPEAAIACSAAACSSCWISSVNPPSTCAGTSTSTVAPPEHAEAVRATATAIAETPRILRRNMFFDFPPPGDL